MKEQRKTPKQLTDKVASPEELAERLIKENKDGGAILLDDFVDQTDAPRFECVRILKNNPHGLFIVGRKGHKSRWVYGKMAQDIRNSSFSNPVRRTNRPTGRINRDMAFGELKAEAFKLRIMVQGQTMLIPVDQVELVTTA